MKALLGGRAARPEAVRRYQVNVLVTRAAGSGAPVVYEDHPTHANLVGRVEHVSELGNLVTDFTLDPGGGAAPRERRLPDRGRAAPAAAAAAPGTSSSARCARSVVRIESLGQALSLDRDRLARAGADPARAQGRAARRAPPLLPALRARPRVRGAVQGRRRLRGGDRAHARGRAALRAPARDVGAPRGAAAARRAGAVARAVEQASRRAADAERLQVHAETLADLLREADHLAGEGGAAVVDGRARAGRPRRAGAPGEPRARARPGGDPPRHDPRSTPGARRSGR